MIRADPGRKPGLGRKKCRNFSASKGRRVNVEPGAYAIVGSALLQQRRLEILANNLAQINTPGFKADVPVFRIYDNAAGAEIGGQFESAVVQQSTWKFTHIDFTQGPANLTNNPLDLALNGDGFFVLQSPDGPRYTRSGRFTLNGEGQIVASQGWPVLGQGGAPIQISNVNSTSGGIFINESGQVISNGAVAGQIKIVDFPKPYALEKKGFSSFAPVDPTLATTTPKDTKIQQGYIEGSNVNAIGEMTKLIEISRLYEAYQKMLQSFDEVDNTAVNDLGEVTVI